ncbi:Leucine-rich repeat receptor-like tyrosine-protein kinase PXC3 [Vitis vinifera]|uniref:Leucine-rich repeat receptor-like tyrosine-protein kinase PXC3 n=1 Tax=Vitis vinifera TaxID=29760 RepID=A0A438EMY2_VITVI|nr:Leucine-rich repeat receptor-like tyrosine-protein kinase PXC3 [Vitis vinifera]
MRSHEQRVYFFFFFLSSVPFVLSLSSTQKEIMEKLSRSVLVWGNEKEPNPCAWKGVSCSSDYSSIANLSLSGLSLSDSSFLPLVCEIVSLEALDLSDNSFSSVPEGFITACGKIDGLKQLNFRSLNDLKRLYLTSNYLSGNVPINLGNSKVLEHLILSKNSFTGSIPDGLLEYRKLVRIDLSENQLSGPLPGKIGDLSKLEELILSSNNLSGEIPMNLSNFQNLLRFAANQNKFIGNIPVGISRSLKNLDLSYNKLGGQIPTDLLMQSNLQTVDLSYNLLEGSIPAKISPNMLENNSLSGSIPSELGSCRSLALLNLGMNYLTGSLPVELASLSSLQVLKLQSNKLNLTNLNLQGNRLSGSIPATIDSLKYLLELQLGNNQLNGHIPGMPLSLQIALNLSHNLFEGAIPETLSRLQGLEVLDLSNNKFSGAIPTSLTQIGSLTQLLLANNQLSGVIPEFGKYVTIIDTMGNPRLVNRTLQRNSPQSFPGKRKSVAVAVVIAVTVAAASLGIGVTVVIAVSISRRFYRVKDEPLGATEDLPPPQVVQGNLLTAMLSIAVMPSGRSYFIKKINWSDKIFQLGSHEKLGQELEILGKLSNSNVMTPLAYVLTVDSAYLFYEYAQKGTLFDILHGSFGSALDWASRYSIAMGIAQGLAFLHGHTSGPVLLLDLSSKSIMLKSVKEPQIGDIELYKVIDPSKSTGSVSTVAGSVGYVPPEYAYTMRVTMAGNVYSFGVILLELLTGKPPVSEGTELARWGVEQHSTARQVGSHP